MFISCPGLISQVAEDLWEVKDKTVRNLTKDDITIIDYKKNLVQQSMSSATIPTCGCLIFVYRSSGAGESEAYQQEYSQGQDLIKIHSSVS